MDSSVGGMLAGMWLGLVIFAIVLATAWIIMPFAIIGTKPILRDVLAELKTQNQLLRDLARSNATQTSDSSLPPSLRSTPLFTEREHSSQAGAIGAESPRPRPPPA